MSQAEDQEDRDFQSKDDKSPMGESPNPHDPRFDGTTETFVDSTQIIGTEIGRYHILSVLGEGGGGVVYLAQQNHPIKRRVALKVIKPGMDSKQVIARFEAERQALALLDHPNIAHVYDGGSTQTGLPYFVMEFVRGVPLLAGPETATYRIHKFAQKYHAFLTAIFTIMIVLVIGVLVSTAMFKSHETEGSASFNIAVHTEGFDIKTNFNVYDVDLKRGTSRVIREGFKDQDQFGEAGKQA